MVVPRASQVGLFAVASVVLLLIPGPAVLYVVTGLAELLNEELALRHGVEAMRDD
jgi:hypothetical protein